MNGKMLSTGALLLLLLALLAAACSTAGDDDDDSGAADDDAASDDDNDAADDDAADDDAADDDAADDDDDAVDDDAADDDAAETGFVLITAGVFDMGSPLGEPGHTDDETLHQVTLTNDFMMQITEVTQSGYAALMGWSPTQYPDCGDDCPEDWVTWYAALAFANELSDLNGYEPCFTLSNVTCYDESNVGDDYLACMNEAKGGINTATVALTAATIYACEGYRLPTEAEWEFAARAGTTAAYHDGLASDVDHLLCQAPFHLTDIAWYCAEAPLTPQPVGGKVANDNGLYDMSGNLWEWVWDIYGAYEGDATDPTGAATGAIRIARGSSWDDGATDLRSAKRGQWDPGTFSTDVGFRLVRTAP